jgi:hypothetical protein
MTLAAAGAGVAGRAQTPYSILEQLVTAPARLRSGAEAKLSAPRSAGLPKEQYLFFDTATVTDNSVLVAVPPLYHEIVTATLVVARNPTAMKAAQSKLEAVLAGLERSGLLDYRPAGLGLAVNWGLPYFTSPLLGTLWKDHAPVDLLASKARGTATPVLLDSVRFTTDPGTMILEANDVAVTMASDNPAHLATAYEQLFGGSMTGIFKVTSRRMGFVDASQLQKRTAQSLTKRFALANKLPAAASIPDQAEMFLGFTSTQRAALGPSVIANFESLGYTNQTTASYFAGGTTMALSHIYEDLASWYQQTYEHRVGALFNPRVANPLRTPVGTLTLDETTAPAVETEAEVFSDASTYKLVGHSSAMQPITRLATGVRDPYGNYYPAGTSIPVRADFNTVDHPFAYTSDPAGDGEGTGPVAGLHFVIFVPSSFFFERTRAAMDGQYPGKPGIGAPAQRTAFMDAFETTHRQNFLTPPRAHRSFPLVELLD